MNDEVEKPSFTIPEHCSYNISEYDLALHPDIVGNPSKAPKELLNRCLWDLGCDTKGYKIVTVKCRHRTLAGKSKVGLLYCCVERSDPEWMRSGYATTQGIISNERDWELQNDLRRLNR